MGCDSGETLHGFRPGCAITLALSEAELPEIMVHVGWSRRHRALHYLQLAKVLNPTGASGRLAAANVPSVTSEREDEQLKTFCVCFPGRYIHETSSKGLAPFLTIHTDFVYVLCYVL